MFVPTGLRFGSTWVQDGQPERLPLRELTAASSALLHSTSGTEPTHPLHFQLSAAISGHQGEQIIIRKHHVTVLAKQPLLIGWVLPKDLSAPSV